MNKKKIGIISLVAVILAVFVFVIFQQKTEEQYVIAIPNTTSAKLLDDYTSEDDLLAKSEYILEGTVTEISEPFVYSKVPFVKITFQVEDTLFAKNNIGDTVTILRESEMFTPLEINHKYILYLYDYEGPVAKDVKMVCGANIGAMEISTKSGEQKGESLKTYKERIRNYINEKRSTE